MQYPSRRYGSLRPETCKLTDICRTVCQQGLWRVDSRFHTLVHVLQQPGLDDLSILNSTTMQEVLETPLSMRQSKRGHRFYQ